MQILQHAPLVATRRQQALDLDEVAARAEPTKPRTVRSTKMLVARRHERGRERGACLAAKDAEPLRVAQRKSFHFK